MASGSIKLLFDENFSHRHIEFVAGESRLAEMQHIRPLQWSGQADSIWIPRAVTQGFVIVTGDRNERTRGYTVADLKTMSARVLLVGEFFDHAGKWDKAKWLVTRIEKIVAMAESMNKGEVKLVDYVGNARDV